MGGPVEEEERVSEPPPPRRLGTDPKMLGIVFGVLGIASLIALVGAIFALRKGAAQEKKEEEPTATYAKETPSASASASAAEPESASAAPAPPPSTLAKGFGWLTLEGPSGTVLVKGKPWGATGTKIAVPCGHVWISVGQVNDKGKIEKTFTKPKSIYVKCGGETTATVKSKS